MTLEQLRLKHPRLVYKAYTIKQESGVIAITFDFILEPDVVFQPKITIPYSSSIDVKFLEPYVFNLGMVEAISYWKSACPAELVVEAASLNREQILFWYDLFIHGLGEFFYRNQIDFTKPDFLKITPSVIPDQTRFAESRRVGDPVYNTLDSRVRGNDNNGSDLVLVGGGKDSAVTLGILKKSNRTIQTMILNPTIAALENSRIAGYTNPIVVTRIIDPQLLELNTKGYLNGHTPFSAYLAFLGVMVAALYGYENVIVSNEKSANEGNVMFHGMEVNHQYSKSFRFEEAFRVYHPNYFSFLRPLNDVQIAKIFAKFPEYFGAFRSCNVGSKTNTWCGRCAKCAFTYLMLFPFVPCQQMIKIFGSDYFKESEILVFIKELVGLTPMKPFECVGTRDESKLAVILSIEKYQKEGVEIPEELLKIKSDMGTSNKEIMENWGDIYNLPPEHQAILQRAYE